MSLEFKVEKYRDKDECQASWNLRRRFLMAHHDKFPENRLVCLAQCFVNVQLYGNKYPPGVMVQLSELAKDMPELVEERKERVKSKYSTMNFVKAATDKGNDELRASKPIPGFISPPQASVEGKMGFVKSESDYKSTEIHSSQYQDINQTVRAVTANRRAHFEMTGVSPKKKSRKSKEVVNLDTLDSEQTFALLRQQLRHVVKNVSDNPVSMLNMALQKVKMNLQFDFAIVEVEGTNMFQCGVTLDSVHVATGVCRNKKSAKKKAVENAIEQILKDYHLIQKKEDDTEELLASDTPFEEEVLEDPVEQLEGKQVEESEDMGLLPNGELTYETNAMNIGINSDRRNRRDWGSYQNSKDLNELIFLYHGDPTTTTATGLLRQSADFSKMLLEYDFSACPEGVSCRIMLEGQPLVECTGPSKPVAKNEASESAVDLLKRMCWSIIVKQAADSDASKLSKDEVIGDVEKSMCVIPDSNVGNKLLRKMGWAGGGVGKDGTGRAEPVTVDQVVNRAGLGLDIKKGISGDFKAKIKKYVEDYASSDNPDDLVFAPDLRKEERAVIHQHCQRLGLKSRSHGTGDDRYLVISRKRTPAQLFHHIMSKGGSTSKYELLPPQR